MTSLPDNIRLLTAACMTFANRGNKMSTQVIHVPMSGRDALLLPLGSGEGHRGIWFYDPDVWSVKVGDMVIFVSGCEEVARGIVNRMGTDATDLLPEAFKLYCSRVNGKVFEWEEVTK